MIIGNKNISLDDINSILFENNTVELDAAALKRVDKNFLFLNEFCKGKLIYGINTGFGPMAQYKIADSDLRQLQYNLIRSHCSGTGKLLSPEDVKATMIVRLVSLMKGFSGINREWILLLKELINRNIFPCIYEHGGVGASGDLVQLAHLALALIGEGEVFYNGKIESAENVFKKEKLKPVSIHKREGIAVLNGTSAMAGIGAINLIHAKKLLHFAVVLSCMITELMDAFDDHISEELHSVKPHEGQQKIASAMRQILSGSKLIRKREEHLYKKVEIVKEKVQEYYSIRCVPQILGPVSDTIDYAGKVVLNEINSVNDNPVITSENVFHGGNFHGDYVSFEMDKLKIAVAKLAMLAERQLNYLLNDKLNQKLPPFVNLGKPGFNFGAQGLQFTATSTVAECQALANPVYIHSIPNNNDNQDVVSMGTNSALIARKVIENAFEVQAIHSIVVVQAIDCAVCSENLSPFSKNIYKQLRKLFPKIIDDKPFYKNISETINYLKKQKISTQ